MLHALGGRAVVTPNSDELEEIYGLETKSAGALATARRAAEELRAVVVLKGRV